MKQQVWSCKGLPTNDADASLTGIILDDLRGFLIELECLYTQLAKVATRAAGICNQDECTEAGIVQGSTVTTAQLDKETLQWCHSKEVTTSLWRFVL